MKKILLLSVLALGISAVNAQTISVTVEGKPVENGATIDSYHILVEDQEDEIEGEIFQYQTFMMDPEVMASSSVDAQFDITVTNTTVKYEAGMPSILFCWPIECATLSTSGASETQTGPLTSTPVSLGIDTPKKSEVPWANPYTLSCKVLIKQVDNPSNTFSFDVNMIYDPKNINAVEGIQDDAAPAVYYDLMGRRIDNPEKGRIVIERRGAKAVKKIF